MGNPEGKSHRQLGKLKCTQISTNSWSRPNEQAQTWRYMFTASCNTKRHMAPQLGRLCTNLEHRNCLRFFLVACVSIYRRALQWKQMRPPKHTVTVQRLRSLFLATSGKPARKTSTPTLADKRTATCCRKAANNAGETVASLSSSTGTSEVPSDHKFRASRADNFARSA